MQATEGAKREKFEKEIRTLNDWAAAGAKDGEECGWLCGEAGGYEMTLADIAYFPFMERIDATLKTFKVRAGSPGHGVLIFSVSRGMRRLLAARRRRVP